MSRWALKDKNGKYRSRRAFKQDCARDSDEPWELGRQTLRRKLKKVI